MESKKKIFSLGVISSYSTLIVGFIINLISIPLGLKYFGVVQFGILTVIYSLISYLNLSRLGINSAAVTLIAKSGVKEEQYSIIKRSFIFQFIIILFLILALLILNYFFPQWVNLIGKYPQNLFNEVSKAINIIFIFFLFSLPLDIFNSAFVGFQKLYIDRIFVIFRSLMEFISLIMVVLLKWDLIHLSLIRGLGYIFINIISLIYFIKLNPNFLKRLTVSASDQNNYKLLFNSSIKFFLISIFSLIIWNTDNLVISNILGVEKVTPYAVTFKFYSILYTFILFINTPLAPLYGKAIAENNWGWIKENYERFNYIMIVLSGAIWVFGMSFAEIIIKTWAGPEAFGGFLILFSLGGWMFILAYCSVNSTLLTGLNLTGFLTLTMGIESIINIIISIFLVKRIGIGGAALGTFIAALVASSWSLPLIIKKQTNNKITFDYKLIIKAIFFIILPFMILPIISVYFIKSDTLKYSLLILNFLGYILLSWLMMPKNIKSYLIEQIDVFKNKVLKRELK